MGWRREGIILMAYGVRGGALNSILHDISIVSQNGGIVSWQSRT